MKRKIIFIVLGVMLLLIPGALWAVNQPGVSQDTPAILVSLGQANAIPLDDAAAAAVRGQAGTDYELVKVIGLNMLDFGSGQYGKDVKWTWNPLGYRYGYWGGPGWSGSGTEYADAMDNFFRTHDLVYADPTKSTADKFAADNGLLNALQSLLPTTKVPYWGYIYISSPTGLPDSSSVVNVSGLSLIGGKFFFGWKPMPYTEYSRREAVTGMQLLIAGKSILRIN